MRVFRKRMLPKVLVCVLCTGGEEDYFHPFFECPFAREVWIGQPISRADVSSVEAFYGSLHGGVSSMPVEQGRAFSGAMGNLAILQQGYLLG